MFGSISKRLAQADKKDALEDRKKGIKKTATIIKAKSDAAMAYFKVQPEDNSPPVFITKPQEMDR